MIRKINLPSDDYCWHIEEVMDDNVDSFEEYLGYLDKAYKTISEDEGENGIYFSFIEYCNGLKEEIECLIRDDYERFICLEIIVGWLNRLINEGVGKVNIETNKNKYIQMRLNEMKLSNLKENVKFEFCQIDDLRDILKENGRLLERVTDDGKVIWYEYSIFENGSECMVDGMRRKVLYYIR